MKNIIKSNTHRHHFFYINQLGYIFFFCLFYFILFLFYFLTLQYCIGFAIQQHESTTSF